MNSLEIREARESGEWPEGYKGSTEERLDQMLADLKAISYAAMQNDDIGAAQLCLVAHEAINAAERELEQCCYVDAAWTDVLKMHPPSENER